MVLCGAEEGVVWYMDENGDFKATAQNPRLQSQSKGSRKDKSVFAGAFVHICIDGKFTVRIKVEKGRFRPMRALFIR